jgi:plasmid maintenance system antidote protein VapI
MNDIIQERAEVSVAIAFRIAKMLDVSLHHVARRDGAAARDLQALRQAGVIATDAHRNLFFTVRSA